MAAATSTRPVPTSYGEYAGSSPWALLTSCSLSCSPLQPGCSWARIAAAPETCGVAIEVPLRVRYIPVSPSVMSCDRAAVMSTPGAEMSGLSAPLFVSGPVLEKEASASCLSTAPTVSADAAAPGAEIDSGPALPEAITKRVPYCSERVSTACDIGSLPSEGATSPRLMLTTRAPDSAAHSIPASTHESCPEP